MQRGAGPCDADYPSDCSEVERVLRVKRQLQADLSTYEHLEHVRRLLREVGNALIARGESHDRSKLGQFERETFAEYSPKLKGLTYGSDEYKRCLEGMAPALTHHYACNRHHPEHFVQGINGMNLVDVVEMFVDWLASTRRHADGDIHKSIEINKTRFGMSEQLTSILRNTAFDLERKTLFDNTSEPMMGNPRVKTLRKEHAGGKAI